MGPILNRLMIFINRIHDFIIRKTNNHFNLTDKHLHFIFMAMIGMLIFLIVLPLFKYLAKKSITSIAFIYSFTCLVVITFAIEIGQKVTGGGHMEFSDIAYGLYGFIVFFVIYLMIAITVKLIIKLIKKQ